MNQMLNNYLLNASVDGIAALIALETAYLEAQEIAAANNMAPAAFRRWVADAIPHRNLEVVGGRTMRGVYEGELTLTLRWAIDEASATCAYYGYPSRNGWTGD